jgi:hypothetical protein
MNEKELETHLVKMVKEFASKRNDAENHVRGQYEAQRKAQRAFNSDEERFTWQKNNPQINWFDEFSKLLSPLFDTYCTSKKRVYGGTHGYSFGFPVKFNGIENPVSTGIELKTKTVRRYTSKPTRNFRMSIYLCCSVKLTSGKSIATKTADTVMKNGATEFFDVSAHCAQPRRLRRRLLRSKVI